MMVTDNPNLRDIPTYVLVTPARNEECFIENTIKSVLSQTVKPLRWVIVSDGSSDRTDEIVSRFAINHPWIELVRTPERTERHFAGKVCAFNMGYARLKDLKYDIIGNLDADISFGPDYFSFLVGKFAKYPNLGVGGTPFREGTDQYNLRYTSTNHVSGACQLFRRECFEAIGGYTPLKRGGIDLLAVLSARMMGWKTQSFTEKTCQHNKQTQIGKKNGLKTLWRAGYHDYLMGSHIVWHAMRSAYHMAKPPYVVGGTALLGGYLWAVLTKPKLYVSDELKSFRKEEQMQRIRSLIGKFI